MRPRVQASNVTGPECVLNYEIEKKTKKGKWRVRIG